MATIERNQVCDEKRLLGEVTGQLAELAGMTTSELRDRYSQVFGTSTESRNRDYLRKKIAWQLQAQAEGGLSRRALDRIEELAPLAPVRWRPDLSEVQLPPLVVAKGKRATRRDPRLPTPGSVITREYQGEKIYVVVLAGGFEFRGKRYSSLSRLAREITGKSWNGFTFFNLTKGPASQGGDPCNR